MEVIFDLFKCLLNKNRPTADNVLFVYGLLLDRAGEADKVFNGDKICAVYIPEVHDKPGDYTVVLACFQ